MATQHDAKIVGNSKTVILVLGTIAAVVAALVFALPARTPGDLPIKVVFEWSMSALALGAYYCAFTCEVVADAHGLRWRNGGRWHHATWEQVTDYYFQGVRETTMVVETTEGKIKWGRDCSNTDALREYVRTHAIRCGGQPWADRGLREHEGPATLSYNRRQLQAQAAAMTACVCLEAGGFAGLFIACLPPPLPRLAVTAGALVALYAASLCRKSARRALARANDQITVDKDGISFVSSEQQIQATWPEVIQVSRRALDLCSGLVFLVRTTNGDFTFTSSIARSEALLRRLRNLADGRDLWTPDSQEDLAPAHHVAGSDLTFHYRNRTNRAMLALGAFLALCPAMVSALRNGLGIRGPSIPEAAFISACLLVPVVAGISYYRTAWVRIDETGITYRGLGKPHHILWADVRDYSTDNALNLGTIRMANGVKRIPLCTADPERLDRAIREHVAALKT